MKQPPGESGSWLLRSEAAGGDSPPGGKTDGARGTGWPELPGYEVLRLLGVGGMGLVYEGRARRTGQRVAIKMLRPELLASDAANHRFSREARHMRKLAHPRVLPILEIGEARQGPFLVTPFMAGGSLATWLERSRSIVPTREAPDPLDALPRPKPEGTHSRPERAAGGGQAATGEGVRAPTSVPARDFILRVVRHIAEALDHAHRQGIIHGDVKPANVLLDAEGNARLADFGLARATFNDSLVDIPGSACGGTLPYFSPAVAWGEVEDTRRDIYALGALLYQMLTGQPPYAGSADILQAIRTGPPNPIRELNPKADPGLTAIAEKAMARERRDRYADFADLLADLDRVARYEWPAGSQVRRRFPRWAAWGNRKLTILAMAGTALVLCLLYLVTRDKALLDERFDSLTLGTNNWRMGRQIVPEVSNRLDIAASGWPPRLTNGTLILTNLLTSAPDKGWAIKQDIWVETVGDFRNSGEMQIQVDFEASALSGNIYVAIVDAPSSTVSLDRGGCARLFTKSGGLLDGLRVPRTTLVVDLSSSSRRAVVHPLKGQPGGKEIIELNHLNQWHLYLGVGAAAAAQMNTGQVSMTIHRVRISTASRRTRMVGYVTSANSGLPMTGITVRNLTSGDTSVTGRKGAFDLKAKPGANHLAVADPDVTILQGQQSPFTAAGGLSRQDLVTRRDPPALGDALNRVVWEGEAIGALCLRQGHFVVASQDGEKTGIYEVPSSRRRRAGGGQSN